MTDARMDAIEARRERGMGLWEAEEAVAELLSEVRMLSAHRAILRGWWVDHYGNLDKLLVADAEEPIFASDLLGEAKP